MKAFWQKHIRHQNWHTLIAWLPTLVWIAAALALHDVAVGKNGTVESQHFFYYSKWLLLILLLIAIVSAVRRKLTLVGWIGLIPSTFLTLVHALLTID